jgi:acetyl esterase/lipase
MYKKNGMLTSILCLLVFVMPEILPAQFQLKPPYVVPDNVTVVKNIIFGTGGGRDLHLDLFLPNNEKPLRPGIVFIHGGGWKKGDKTKFQRQAAHLASKGFIGACIEYRLSGEAKFPAAVQDCKCAVRWMRANAKKYRIDPDRIAVMGGSAGGHLAAQVGTTDESFRTLEGNGGHAQYSSRVQAVVSYYGKFDVRGIDRPDFFGQSYKAIPDLYALGSPIVHVTADDPPMLLCHGTADETVPYAQSVRLHAALRTIGVHAVLKTAEGAGHGCYNRPPWYTVGLQQMEEFLTMLFFGR